MFRNRQQLLADLSIGVIAFIWGFTFTVVKNALEDIQPFAFLFLRFLLAVIIVLPFILFTKRRKSLPVKAGIIAGIFLFIGFAGQTIGLQHTTASKSAFITGLNVIFVPIFAAIFEKRTLGKKTFVAVVLATAGLYLLTNPQAQSFNIGDAWTILCAIGFALHIVTLDFYAHKTDYVGLFFLQILVVFLVSGLFLPLESPDLKLVENTVTLNIFIAILVTGALATALAFFIQNWAQRVTSATRTALLLTLEPVFAALTAYILLTERLGISGIIGGLLILAGIVIAEIKAANQTSDATPK